MLYHFLLDVFLVMMIRGGCDNSGEVVSVNGSVFTSDKFKVILEEVAVWFLENKMSNFCLHTVKQYILQHLNVLIGYYLNIVLDQN